MKKTINKESIIKISRDVLKQLRIIKATRELKTIDETINYLLEHQR